MSKKNGNGDSGAPTEAPPEETAEKAVEQNAYAIEEGVMTMTIYLENDPSAFVKAIGSLVLAQDLVKNYFGNKAVADAAIKARNAIIKPGIVH